MLVVVVLVVVGVVIGVLLAQRGTARARQRVEDRLATATVLRRDKAELRGVLGEDGGPTRGLGQLALTPDELVFVLYVGEGELRIPRSSIASVTVSRSLGDATFATDVLAVAHGGAEAAFEVPDLDAWLADLGGSRPGTAP